MAQQPEVAVPYLDIAHENGSREFEPALRKLGLPTRIRTLTCGDFAFYGNGPDGTIRIGIERKRVGELVGEDSRRRFVGRQLPRMVARYDYRFLLIEGLTRFDNREGILQEGRDLRTKRGANMTLWRDAGWGRAGSTYERYVKELLTVRLRASFHVLTTANASETAYCLHALYRWWQKDWFAHRSHLAVEQSEPDILILTERTFRRQTFAQWPGVGWKRSAKVSQYFPSVAAAAVATEDEWMTALGIKNGRKIAKRLVAMLHGNGDELAKGV